jgi:hypothetical protein
MKSSMIEMNIGSIQLYVKNVVNLSLELKGKTDIYLIAQNFRGKNEIFIDFESAIPSTLGYASFDAKNPDMDEEAVMNEVLDWLLTEDGTKTIEEVCIKYDEHFYGV